MRRGGRVVRCLALVGLVLTTGCAVPRWPVDAALISPYGLRFRGIRPDIHRGVDLAAPAGTAIRTMAPGRVRFAGTMSGYGNVVWVDHGGSVLTIYAHLSRIDVETGQVVDGRTILGRSGASGNATGPHLHFEVWRWGRAQDPVRLLGGQSGGNP